MLHAGRKLPAPKARETSDTLFPAAVGPCETGMCNNKAALQSSCPGFSLDSEATASSSSSDADDDDPDVDEGRPLLQR